MLSFPIVGQKPQGNNIIFYHDINGDGKPELKILYKFENGKLTELERSEDVSDWKQVIFPKEGVK